MNDLRKILDVLPGAKSLDKPGAFQRLVQVSSMSSSTCGSLWTLSFNSKCYVFRTEFMPSVCGKLPFHHLRAKLKSSVFSS